MKSEYKQNYTRAELKCQSSCQPDHQSYIWIKNGWKHLRETSSSVSVSVYSADRYSCALKGYEEFPSISVCEFTLQSFKKLQLQGFEFTARTPLGHIKSHLNLTCFSGR
ncbi:hypothetical protein XENORESO_004290 [Xenotaenia resolanae]|uniref:Ig-like domain-containing protein n=1 Tax=Xenotaenia resolanae TaxID=208358 RepID=A0ABV0W807_9TELE